MSHSLTSELPVLRPVARSSTIDLITEEIRNAIYRGSLLPGRPISEVRTAELLGVSRPALREALQRLVSEGSLSHAPGRGAWVRRMGDDDIEDVYAVREAIETQAVRIIIRTGRSTVLIDAAFDALAAAIEGGVARVIGDADLEFHHAIVTCSGSSRLADLMKASMVHTRLLSLSDPGGYEVRCDLIDTHAHLARAIADGEEAEAVGIVETIMAESVARLRHAGPNPGAEVVEEDHDDRTENDQWSCLVDQG